MSFSDQFAADALPELMRQFGESATYTPPDAGEAVSLSVVIRRTETTVETYREGRRKVTAARCLIALDPDGPYGGVASPSDRATITDASGNTWSVAGERRRLGGWVWLAVTRSAIVRREQSGARRDRAGSTFYDRRRSR